MRKLMLLVCGAIAISCAKDLGKETSEKSSDNEIKNITAYAESDVREKDVLDIEYSSDQTVINLVSQALPVTETPVDPSRIHIEINVAQTAKVNISPLDVIDLSDNDATIEVTAENGDVKRWTVHYIETPAYEIKPEFDSSFEELWVKQEEDLQLSFPETVRGIAVCGDYVLVLDSSVKVGHADVATGAANGKIRLYDRISGEYVKDVPRYEGGWNDLAPYIWSLASDDAGHFATAQMNADGANCRLEYYTDFDAAPITQLKPDVAPAEQMTPFLGRKLQILGDITQGKSLVLMTPGHFYGWNPIQGSYSIWTFIDGNPENPIPAVNTLPYNWYHATIQRASVDDPTLYIAYNDETGYPDPDENTWWRQHAAHFQISVPGSTPVEMNQDCMLYRMHDMKVFACKEGLFMASLQQTYSRAGVMKTIVYDITDPKKVESMSPESELYSKFNIYESEGYKVVNDEQYGSVAVFVDKETDVAYIYTYIPQGPNPDNRTEIIPASLSCVKMSIVRTN